MVNPVVIEAAAQATLELYIQNKKSIDDGLCLYRSDMGACLIGHMIIDEHYHSDMESNWVKSPVVTRGISKSLGLELSQTDISFLDDIQREVHDSVTVKKVRFQEAMSNQLRGEDLAKYPLFTERALELITEYMNQ